MSTQIMMSVLAQHVGEIFVLRFDSAKKRDKKTALTLVFTLEAYLVLSFGRMLCISLFSEWNAIYQFSSLCIKLAMNLDRS